MKPENVKRPVLIDLVMSKTRRKFALDTEHATALAAMMEQPASVNLDEVESFARSGKVRKNASSSSLA